MKALKILTFLFLFSLCAEAQTSGEGPVSFYSDDLIGSFTAYGDQYDASAKTGAHATLPPNSWVKITCLANGKTTTVRINDKLAPNSKKTLMISRAAAEEINLTHAGVLQARYELITEQSIGPAPEFSATKPLAISAHSALPEKFSGPGLYDCDGNRTSLDGYVVQVAALSNLNSFDQLCAKLKAIKPDAKVAIQVVNNEVQKLYRVLVKAETSQEASKETLKLFTNAGMKSMLRMAATLN